MVNKDTVTKQENKLQSLSKEIKTTFKAVGCEMIEISGDINGYDKIVDEVLQRLEIVNQLKNVLN